MSTPMTGPKEMASPERVLAEALHKAEVSCWPNTDGCTKAEDHNGDALDMLAHQPLRDALTRGLAGSGVVECICAITGPAGGGHPNIDCPFHVAESPALTAARLADALHDIHCKRLSHHEPGTNVPWHWPCYVETRAILAALATPEEATR